MSGVLKKIGNALHKVAKPIFKNLKKIVTAVIVVAAVYMGGALFAKGGAGAFTASGAGGTLGTGVGTGAAGAYGVSGTGLSALQAGSAGGAVAGSSLGGGMASPSMISTLSKTGAKVTTESITNGEPISDTTINAGNANDAVTGQDYFKNIWSNVKDYGKKTMDWMQKNPTLTQFLGNTMQNYAKLKAEAEAMENEPKYHGTYFGYTPDGEYYDPARGEMVSHQTPPLAPQAGLIAPQRPTAAPAAPSAPRPNPIRESTEQFRQQPAMASVPEVGDGLITADPSRQPTSGFNFVQPGLIQPQHRRLGA